MIQKSLIGLVVVLCWMGLTCAWSVRARANDDSKIHWKPVDAAQLKLDGKTPLMWSVYQPDKKKDSNLVLILLGRRYLAFDIKARLVYAVFPADLQPEGKDFETDDLMQASRVIPSSEWEVRDVGPQESIKLKMGDYGRMLEIDLPHLWDLRRGVY